MGLAISIQRDFAYDAPEIAIIRVLMNAGADSSMASGDSRGLTILQSRSFTEPLKKSSNS